MEKLIKQHKAELMTHQNSGKDTFTQRLNELIETNMSNERFGVSELAGEMHMSRSNLHRRIKSVSGASVSQFLRKARLNKALELLKNDSFTVSEVAFKVGFGSATYFSSCFRDYFGYAPGKVAKNELNESGVEKKSILNNFPVQTTSFIGREKEIRTIIGLIEEHNIVSLVGTGGCGKTRLACEVVAQLFKEYKDGIWFVDLAPVESEELVTKQLMNTLGICEIPGRDMTEILANRIRDKKLLILLDNCEHLLRACAELSGELSESVPGLSLVVTSRESLNIKGERVWVVTPLTLIDPASIIDAEHARSSESVRLFSDRAILNNPGFELVEENASDVATICQRVDGIPLAVELVASRTRYMDTMTMLDRLSERFAEIPSRDPRTIERQKTLQATIEWSYNLLTEEEKALFRRLCVFTGGFDPVAVEEVCANESMPNEIILNLLCHLVDKSMIQTTYLTGQQMRYNLLETMQQHASTLLIEMKEAEETRKKHLNFFTKMAEQAYEERISSQAKWLEKLQMEHNNMLVALRWADLHDPEKFSWLAGTLSWFWARSSHYSTARELLDRAIASNIGHKETQARVVTGYGTLLITADDLERARDLLNQGLSLWRELTNKKEESLVLAEISNLLYMIGEDEAGVKYAKEGFSLAEELKDPGIELYCMLMVSQGLVDLKKTDEARSMARRILKLAEELENLLGIFVAHHQLGDCAIMEGQYIESEREYGQGLETTIKSGDTSYSCAEMLGIAMSVAGQGRFAKALRINAAATKIARSFECAVPEEYTLVFWQELVNKHIVVTRKKLGEKLTMKYEEEGRSLIFEKVVEYALDIDAE